MTDMSVSPTADRILREAEVLRRTGLSRSSRYRLSKEGKFPGRVRIGDRSHGWIESDINAWIAERASKKFF